MTHITYNKLFNTVRIQNGTRVAELPIEQVSKLTDCDIHAAIAQAQEQPNTPVLVSSVSNARGVSRRVIASRLVQ